MAFIVQGSNEPITIEVTEVDMSRAESLSAALSHNADTFKHWALSDVSFDSDKVIFPLTEDDTMAISCGEVLFEVKFAMNGKVEFLETIALEVVPRYDKSKVTSE